MDESRNGRHTRNLIRWVFLVYFPVSLFMLGWLLWPFLSTIVVAEIVNMTLTGFPTLTDIYHASYQNLVEPFRT